MLSSFQSLLILSHIKDTAATSPHAHGLFGSQEFRHLSGVYKGLVPSVVQDVPTYFEWKTQADLEDVRLYLDSLSYLSTLSMKEALMILEHELKAEALPSGYVKLTKAARKICHRAKIFSTFDNFLRSRGAHPDQRGEEASMYPLEDPLMEANIPRLLEPLDEDLVVGFAQCIFGNTITTELQDEEGRTEAHIDNAYWSEVASELYDMCKSELIRRCSLRRETRMTRQLKKVVTLFERFKSRVHVGHLIIEDITDLLQELQKFHSMRHVLKLWVSVYDEENMDSIAYDIGVAVEAAVAAAAEGYTSVRDGCPTYRDENGEAVILVTKEELHTLKNHWTELEECMDNIDDEADSYLPLSWDAPDETEFNAIIEELSRIRSKDWGIEAAREMPIEDIKHALLLTNDDFTKNLLQLGHGGFQLREAQLEGTFGIMERLLAKKGSEKRAGVLLADGMGIGKTYEVLLCIALYIWRVDSRGKRRGIFQKWNYIRGKSDKDFPSRPSVVIVPRNVVSSWLDHANTMFSPCSVAIFQYNANTRATFWDPGNEWHTSPVPQHRRIILVTHSVLRKEFRLLYSPAIGPDEQNAPKRRLVDTPKPKEGFHQHINGTIYQLEPSFSVYEEAHFFRHQPWVLFPLRDKSLFRIAVTGTPLMSEAWDLVAIAIALGLPPFMETSVIFQCIELRREALRAKKRSRSQHPELWNDDDLDSFEELQEERNFKAAGVAYKKLLDLIASHLQGSLVRRTEKSKLRNGTKIVPLPGLYKVDIMVQLPPAHASLVRDGLADLEEGRVSLAQFGAFLSRYRSGGDHHTAVGRGKHAHIFKSKAEIENDPMPPVKALMAAKLAAYELERDDNQPAYYDAERGETVFPGPAPDFKSTETEITRKRLVVIYTEFPHNAPSFISVLWHKHQIKCVHLKAEMSSVEKQRQIRMWRKRHAESRVLMISPADRVGINLSAADRIILLHASWSLMDTMQVVYRVYRQPQKNSVVWYRILAENSPDSIIVRGAEFKAQQLAYIMHQDHKLYETLSTGYAEEEEESPSSADFVYKEPESKSPQKPGMATLKRSNTKQKGSTRALKTELELLEALAQLDRKPFCKHSTYQRWIQLHNQSLETLKKVDRNFMLRIAPQRKIFENSVQTLHGEIERAGLTGDKRFKIYDDLGAYSEFQTSRPQGFSYVKQYENALASSREEGKGLTWGPTIHQVKWAQIQQLRKVREPISNLDPNTILHPPRDTEESDNNKNDQPRDQVQDGGNGGGDSDGSGSGSRNGMGDAASLGPENSGREFSTPTPNYGAEHDQDQILTIPRNRGGFASIGLLRPAVSSQSSISTPREAGGDLLGSILHVDKKGKGRAPGERSALYGEGRVVGSSQGIYEGGSGNSTYSGHLSASLSTAHRKQDTEQALSQAKFNVQFRGVRR